MRKLFLLILLASGSFLSQGCGSDTKTSKPEVIPASPAGNDAKMDSGKNGVGVKAGSSTAVGSTN